MQHNSSPSASVDGDYVSNKAASFNSDTPGCLGALKRQNTSSSDNDVTAPVSTTSSSQGSFQILLEPNDEANQEASPSRRHSPRRKSSLGKTDSMLRGSLNAQDFFGTERVLQDALKDEPRNLPNEGRKDCIQGKTSGQTEKPEVVGSDAPGGHGSLQVSLTSQVAQNIQSSVDPSSSQKDDVLKAEVANCNFSSVLNPKPNEEVSSPNTISPSREQVSSKCQCIIL